MSLADPKLDLKAKLGLAMDLRDSIELQEMNAGYEKAVNEHVPVVLNALKSAPPSNKPTTNEQRLRNTLLDVLSRLKPSALSSANVKAILSAVMEVLQIDNEENGVVCMRIFTNLHRAFKQEVVYKEELVAAVPSFLSFVDQVLSNMEERVATLNQETPPDWLAPATSSFKTLTEMPIIIVLLYSNHPAIVHESLPSLAPNIIKMLKLEAQAQANEHAKAAQRGAHYTGVAVANRAAYSDFITAQIKVMSFLAYALRAYSVYFSSYLSMVPGFVVRLLKDCPCELSGARKELLVSMRHILSTDFRTHFISKVDILLEQDVLIGDGFTSQETLWPLAYSTMADLIHHVRNELTTQQIWKAVKVYTANLHNSALATSFQVMSAKLLLNFMERVVMLPDHAEGRNMMVVILRAFVDRFEDLNRPVSSPSPVIKLKEQTTTLNDKKFVFKSLVAFLKTVMFGFKKCNPPPPANVPQAQWDETARGFSYSDVALFRRLFREVISGLKMFSTSTPPAHHDLAHSPPIVTSKEEKELMEIFATVFIHVDAAMFNEIIEAELDFFYKATFDNMAVLHVTQLFLGNETTSANFSGLFIAFLLEKLPELGDSTPARTSNLLQLFKLCFMAVNLFPASNEQVILPHFKRIIVESLALTSTSPNPIVYSHLLRALFRSIGGGRFEALYKAVLPLLQTLLETLNKLMTMARTTQERDIYVELCLTVPVRLSLLVPHLSYLMRPLVIALNGSPELVSQGLRTLELCVDNLTAAYFDPIIEPVLEDVMKALWAHLRPLPYHHQHSHTTLRILGKLGGRNRAFLKPPADLDSTRDQVALEASLVLNGAPLRVSLTPGIEQALVTLKKGDQNALKFLGLCIRQFIPKESPTASALASEVQQCVRRSISTASFDGLRPLPDGTSHDLRQRDATTLLVERILEGIVEATAHEALREQATQLFLSFCSHCALLELGEFTIEKRRAVRPFSLEDNEGVPYVPPRVVVSAIFYALCHYDEHVRALGFAGIRNIFDAGEALCPGLESFRYPLIRALFSKLSHGCFEESYHLKVGACRGLRFLFIDIKFSPDWIKARHLELIRTVIFVIKDVPEALDDVSELLFYVLSVVDHTNERSFSLLSGLLAFELESANKNVRVIAKRALEQLATSSGKSLAEILSAVTNVFLNPIFVKPLRALPFPMQVGYIEAISYCVELPDTFLKWSDEKLTRLLEEVLALVDAEDDSLTSAHRLLEYTTSQQLVELRVVCIRLLALALTTAPDHFQDEPLQLKSRIISVLLKTLSSPKTKVVDAAHEALKAVLALNPRPPRDILQNGLRPTLVTLSDYSRLTAQGLDSLSRLLELFSNYFKVELGRKLLEHLKDWSKPLLQHSISNSALNSEHIQKGVAILNVFSALPAGAHIYIDDIVKVLLFVENTLRRVQRSPFRAPVAKFFERFPQETVQYFAAHLTNPRFGRVFSDMLEQMPAVRRAVMDNIGAFRVECERPEDRCIAVTTLVHVVYALREEDWLLNQRELLAYLVQAVRALDFSAPAVVTEIRAARERVYVLVAAFARGNLKDDLIFEVLGAATPTDYALVDFLRDSVYGAPLEVRQLWLQRGLEVAVKAKSAFVVTHVINAMLRESTLSSSAKVVEAKAGEAKSEKELSEASEASEASATSTPSPSLRTLLPPTFLPTLNTLVWQNLQAAPTITPLQFAFLETSLLVLSEPALVQDIRKDVVKFGWSFITQEDLLSKCAALVLVSHFIAAFDTTPRLVMQTYMSLLKTHQLEARTMVTQALNALAPVLPTRIPDQWLRGPRRSLTKDGHNVLHVVNIYEFLAAHADLFYEHRAQFLPFILSTLVKVGSLKSSTTTIDVELAELLVKWEQRARAERGEEGEQPKKEEQDEDAMVDEIEEQEPKEEPKEPSGTLMSPQQRYIVLTEVVRYAVASKTPARMLKVLQQLLTLWPDKVELDSFDRVLKGDLSAPANLQRALNALRIIDIAFVQSNVDYLQQLLERPLRSSSIEIHQALVPVLRKVLQSTDLESEQGANFLRSVVSAIQEHWAALAPTSGWIYLAEEVMAVKPSALDASISGLIKGLSKGVRDLFEPPALPPAPGGPTAPPQQIAGVPPVPGGPTAPAAPPPVPSVPMTASEVLRLLELVASRISHLGDQRRAFLHNVAQLCSLDNKPINLRILELVRSWVFSRTELFPTTKEKAALLLKMMVCYEGELLEKFYEIIIGVFEDAELRRSELPARLETPFLRGCTKSKAIRTKLLGILSSSLETSTSSRLGYIFGEQNWEPLADHFWLNEALQLLLMGTGDEPVAVTGFKLAPLSNLSACLPVDTMEEDAKPSAFLEKRLEFLGSLSVAGSELMASLLELQYTSTDLVHKNWLSVFPSLYAQKKDLGQLLAVFLAKEYHTRQAQARPNVVATLLEAFAPLDSLPPKLVKYLCNNYNAWYSGLQIMENVAANSSSATIKECNLDALAETYAGLQESDFFYGLWRTRSSFAITSAALSYEQCGMWSRAMQMHEQAQIKARSGALPYGESEYGLWEDHWILCAEKLQHWDVLTELAKHEGFNDLLLECGWRVADWSTDREPLEQSIKSLMDSPTPRRQVYESFLCLQGFGQKTESLASLSKCCDEGIQLALSKWAGLPRRITAAHIPLLHTFQQYVEFMEASQVYTSLASTTAINLEAKSQELKGVLQAWHERLPNLWDDINIWSDLVTWRQHVFGVINRVYLPLIQPSSSSNTAAYRGYHEIAWIINRFAHVARKHNMTDVCIQLLSKIYTLPNIEVQEAFLKLREQAKCHYQNPVDVSTGLEVISNTNFAFFQAQQKSEFFTLRGMSLAKLGADDRANEQFATAVQIDVYLPKAWAEWGRFNDRKFQENSTGMYGSTAMSCYLQAAGLYKSAKSRAFLGRILWLLGLDTDGSIATSFENYRGETPTWFWVTYIPQLLNSLGTSGKNTRTILIKIAKSYPQALHFHLRTVREEYSTQQRATSGQAVNAEDKQPLQYVEEVMSTLKTSYPLLTLSLETLVDQVYHRFKSPPDEDAYRLIVALLNDGVQYMGRLPCPRSDTKLPPATEASISRFTEGVLPKHIKSQFEQDFVLDKPNLETYVLRLRKWKDRFEAKLDARPNKMNLEALSPPLNEFHYQKFEDVEVPGQSAELRDSNLHFVKIGRFLSNVDVVRGFGVCYRRLTIRGHDGSVHPFAVQYPAARHCRREERVSQIFRILNSVLQKRKESRSRQLQFTLPNVVPLTPHIRLIQDSSSYISMYQIYEKFCQQRGQSRDAPFDLFCASMRAAYHSQLPKPDVPTTKMEILNRIQSELVPTTVLKDYFLGVYSDFASFWLFRKQFAYQYAGITFMTFVMAINSRHPHKFLVNLDSGNVWASEMVPVLPTTRSKPTFLNGESVPFRLTPNIQTLIGPTALEGLYAMSIMIIAKSLSEPEFDLGYFLPVFVRDEVNNWYAQQNESSEGLNDIVKANVETIVKRALSLAQTGQGSIPANQTCIDFISMAVNPRNLALTDVLWMPYL